MVKNVPNKYNLVVKGPTIVKNHPKWSKLVQNGPMITKDQAGHRLHL